MTNLNCTECGAAVIIGEFEIDWGAGKLICGGCANAFSPTITHTGQDIKEIVIETTGEESETYNHIFGEKEAQND